MSQTTTINLCRIPESGHYEELLQKDFTYDENIKPRLAIKRKYLQQRQISQDLLHERSVSLNAHIVDAVKAFVTKSLDLDRSRLFSPADKLYGATLVLDMQISDHELTFNTIEKKLRKLKSTNLCVLRLRSNMMRKKSIVELLEPVRQFKRVFIIIEQAEILTRVLTETLVGQLKNRLSDDESPTESIMVLFCLSVRVQALPFDQMNCFGRVEDIVKDHSLVKASVKEDLMRSKGLEFKLGPDVLDCIYECLVNLDASMTSVSHLYSYAMFQHYHQIESKPDLVEGDFEVFEKKHQFLCDQLDCYAELLKDHDLWPEDTSSLYELLSRHNRLTESTDFVDAVSSLKKVDPSRLLIKIGRALKKFDTDSNLKKRQDDIIAILRSFQDKVINNEDDCSRIVSKLTRDLLNHGERLDNLIKSYESMYFNDKDNLLAACLISMRGCETTIEKYSNKDNYFGIVFEKLIQSTGHVSPNHLCDDVMDDFLKLIRSERKSSESTPDVKPASKRVKKTSKKSSKKDALDGLSRQDEEGLARAIFVDVIDCMEHQHIIKIESRTKQKLIRRLAWPTLK